MSSSKKGSLYDIAIILSPFSELSTFFQKSNRFNKNNDIRISRVFIQDKNLKRIVVLTENPKNKTKISRIPILRKTMFRSSFIRPVFLSSSFLFREPFGISTIAFMSLGAFSLVLTSYHEFILLP